ncbi:MAG: homoserine dehydrogenase [Ardenticatenales bacterium]
MLDTLRQREADGQPIRVALVGAGAMGVGIAWQIGRTPGMRLVAIVDLDEAQARKAAEAYGRPFAVVTPGMAPPADGRVALLKEPFALLEAADPGIDVLVEATNTISFAARVCLAAIERGCHIVLMNAEVDLAVGPLLAHEAARKGVVVTSDAGDQHGVLMRMIEEIELWAFEIVMAGNIKGFLDRRATAAGLIEEARVRNLNPIQCCAYTDGTKLNIEMALVANAAGLHASTLGMYGPRTARVEDVHRVFDFDALYGDGGGGGVVDYILGAEPGGGVFVVGRCMDPLQRGYLQYYKLGDGPYYLFYRPYHLCHLETTRAIALAALYGRAVLQHGLPRRTDVYAFAKRDLAAGEAIPHGIGGDQAYGLIADAPAAEAARWLPIVLLDTESDALPRLVRPVPCDAPLTLDDVAMPDSELMRLMARQRAVLGDGAA